MENTQKVLEAMYNKLDNFLKTETVVGEPIVLGDVKIIPIISASFGLGGGFGEESQSNAGGGGGGLGAKISPDAMLVIKDGEVKLLPVKSKGSSFEKLIEKAPDLIDKLEELKELKEKGKKEKKE